MRSTLFHRSCFLLSASPLSATVDIISALLPFVNPFFTIFLSFLHYRQIFHIILSEGKKKMTAEAFLAGHRLSVGDVIG